MEDASVVNTWERLVRFHRATTMAMDQSLRTTFDYTLDDYDVLHQINFHNGPIRMGDLAERLLIANSSCHRLVARLVDADLIQRHHDESDRRVVLVSLTSKEDACAVAWQPRTPETSCDWSASPSVHGISPHLTWRSCTC